jgi:hypothetical protein
MEDQILSTTTVAYLVETLKVLSFLWVQIPHATATTSESNALRRARRTRLRAEVH